MEWTTLAVAGMSLIGTLAGTFGGILVANKLTTYRIEQLERKVSEHNKVVERTYKLEQRMEVIEAKLEGAENLLTEKVKVANHRIEDLEKAT